MDIYEFIETCSDEVKDLFDEMLSSNDLDERMDLCDEIISLLNTEDDDIIEELKDLVIG